MNESKAYIPDELHASRDTGSEDGVEEQALEHSATHERFLYDQVLLRHALDIKEKIEDAFIAKKIDQTKHTELLDQIEVNLQELSSALLLLKVNELAEKLAIPEEMIRTYTIDIGERAGLELVETMQRENIVVSNQAFEMLKSDAFEQSRMNRIVRTGKESERVDLVRLSVANLGLQHHVSMQEIFERAFKLGLQLCPLEVGPELRLHTKDEEDMYVAMERILILDGHPFMFNLRKQDGRLRLGGYDSSVDNQWASVRRFLFCFPK